MAIKRRNLLALKIYLDELGIDSARVREAGLDETGYDYIKVDRDGRPMYARTEVGQSMYYDTERRAWPTSKVWADVQTLLEGGGLADVQEPVVTSLKGLDVAPKAKTSTELKNPGAVIAEGKK